MERLEQTGKEHIVNGKRIKARKKTHNKWFETQDQIGYWEDFFKPKIVYQELTQGSSFAYDNTGIFVNQSAYIIVGNNLEYLIKFLNSRVAEYVYRHFYATLIGENGLRWLAQNINDLPIPKYKASPLQQQIIAENNDDTIEQLISELYHITEEEQKYILGR